MVWARVVPVTARLGRVAQGLAGVTERTVGALAAERPPPQLHRGQPRALRRSGQPHQPPGRGSHHRLDGLISLASRVVPRPLDGARGRLVNQRRQPFGDRLATLPASAAHHGFARLVVDRAQTIALVRVSWRRPHDWRAPQAPQGAHGGPPAAMAFVRLGQHLAGGHIVTGVCPRLLWSADSGAGLLILCGGRLRTMPAGCSARRPVASATRSPGCAARSSARRGRVHTENGHGTRRGRRRTTASHLARYAAVISAGRPGRGASGHPSRPSARSPVSQRRPVAARSRTIAARWGPGSPCSPESRTRGARVRSRGAVVVRYRCSRSWCGHGGNDGLWMGLIPSLYQHSSQFSWLYLGCS
jgi:hypothetical protein